MTPRQVELVQISFEQVVPIADAVATTFDSCSTLPADIVG